MLQSRGFSNRTLGLTHGSDAALESADAVLLFQTFQITRLDLLRARAGGCRPECLNARNCLDLISVRRNLNHSQTILPWCIQVNYSARTGLDNTCFLRCLHTGLLDLVELQRRNLGLDRKDRSHDPEFGIAGRLSACVRYDSLQKRLRDSYGYHFTHQLDYSTAGELTARCHLTLIVHSSTGEILYDHREGGANSRYLAVTHAPLFRVILDNNHYYGVIKYEPRPVEPEPVSLTSTDRRTRNAQPEWTLNVYYDLETVDSGVLIDSTRLALIYAIAWRVQLYIPPNLTAEEEVEITRDNDALRELLEGPTQCYIGEPDNYTAFDRLFGWLTRTLQTAKIQRARLRLIAFNGAQFDHRLLFGYVAHQGYTLRRKPYNTQVRKLSFVLESTVDRFIRAEVWDPSCFISGSLESAALAFGLSQLKVGYDHQRAQDYFDRGSTILDNGCTFNHFTEEYLLEFGPLIREYCTRDVELLE